MCAERIDEAAGAAQTTQHPKYSPLTRPNNQRSNRRIVTAFPPPMVNQMR